MPGAAAYVRAGLQATAALPRAIAEVGRHGTPRALVYFGAAPGDDLLCTPTVDALAASGAGPIWMMSNHADLFRSNPSIAHVVRYDDGLAWALGAMGVRRLRLRYHEYDPVEDRSAAPADHIIRLMARRAGVESTVRIEPRIYLQESERSWGRFGENQIAIQSSTKSAGMPIATKEWIPGRFQQVVNALKSDFTIVQVGTLEHPHLDGAVDLRGKTTIRQAAAVLHNSLAFVGLVGFLMHLAKAVGTRSAIVYGGREHPMQSGYDDNVNLFTALPCAPCWFWNHCPYEMACMDRIDAGAVVRAVRSITDRR
jgi:ADP-heptose:LPS heptosyltransferase